MLLNILKNISWLDYLLVIALLLTAYYLFIGLRFYADQLKEIFTLKQRLKVAGNGGQSGPESSVHTHGKEEETAGEFDIPIGFENTPEETFEQVERLISTLKSVVQDSAGQQMNKADFSARLRKVLEFYTDLKDSQFQFAVNELIISECEKIDFIPLSEDELMELW